MKGPAKGKGERGRGPFLLLFPLALFPFSSSAQVPVTLGASSLMNDAAARGLIERRTASRKGDVLLIRVNEVMKGQYKATTATSKAASANVKKIDLPILDVLAGPVLGKILGDSANLPRQIVNGVLGGGSTGASETNSGGGSSSTDSSFATEISVKVVDVDSNGLLHIEGTRLVRVNKELQKITLTGVVRPDDVGADNSVPSNRVADVELQADGKGAVAAKTRRSLLNKITDWLF